jgi:hypothetical protein
MGRGRFGGWGCERIVRGKSAEYGFRTVVTSNDEYHDVYELVV